MEVNQHARDHLEWLDRQHVLAAREDPNAFCTYVLRDETTGLPIIQAPYHQEWQAICSREDRAIFWSGVEMGKSQQIAIARVLFDLGRDPTLRVAILSKTFSQATPLVMTIARYIRTSRELHRVFPRLRPAKDQPWTQSRIYVHRGTAHRPDSQIAKDPSVRAVGVHGALLGARIDRLIVDDALDFENTLSEERRDDFDRWFDSTVEGRLTKRAKVYWLGNAWHVDDAMHKRARHPSWKAYRYPVTKRDGTSAWPEQWSEERIAKKRQQLGTVEGARQLDCRARSDEDARFKSAWIDGCLARGEGRTLAHGLNHTPDGYRIFTGVDLAVSKKRRSDRTCLFTIAVSPQGDRHVLDVMVGRWSGPEIIEHIRDVHHRFQSIVLVENNATQEFLIQFARSATDVPVRSFTTGSNKWSPEFGVESLAVEMENRKWVIPSERDGSGRLRGATSAIREWVAQMLYYDPDAHTGDILMAAWFAREGARTPPKKKIRIGHLDLLSR